MVIIITALLLYSCGTTKKMTQTETHSKVNIESSFVDTSKKFESWEVIVNSVVKEIDLSNIRITSYYPEKDSLGQQLIKEIMLIDNNITKIKSETKKELLIKNDEKGVFINKNISEEDKSIISTVLKKRIIPVKLNLIIIIGLFLACLLIYLKFKDIIHAIIKKLF